MYSAMLAIVNCGLLKLTPFLEYLLPFAAPIKETSYATWMAKSIISRGFTPSWHYEQATFYTSLEDLYELSGDKEVYDFYKEQIDSLVNPDGSIAKFNYTDYYLDNYRIGNNILWWWEETGDEKYKIAADDIKSVLDKHPRTPTGGFWHRDFWSVNEMWLDGIYMADSFYAKWTSLFQPNNKTAWDDIFLQFHNIDERTRREDNLLVHGYDESKKAVWADPVTGASPLVWARADGWYAMAMMEVLHLFPQDHPSRKEFLSYYTGQAEGLKNAQDERGAWFNVMDEQYKNVKGNYLESSASAMFTFGWLTGLNDGYLSVSEFKDPAEKAYKTLIERFVTENVDGTINWEGTVKIGSLGSNATFEYYSSIPVVQNDPRGFGPFISAAVQWESRQF